MNTILKKISASLILILMLFSVSFNVLDYGYKVYATEAYPHLSDTLVNVLEEQQASKIENIVSKIETACQNINSSTPNILAKYYTEDTAGFYDPRRYYRSIYSYV